MKRNGVSSSTSMVWIYTYSTALLCIGNWRTFLKYVLANHLHDHRVRKRPHHLLNNTENPPWLGLGRPSPTRVLQRQPQGWVVFIVSACLKKCSFIAAYLYLFLKKHQHTKRRPPGICMDEIWTTVPCCRFQPGNGTWLEIHHELISTLKTLLIPICSLVKVVLWQPVDATGFRADMPTSAWNLHTEGGHLAVWPVPALGLLQFSPLHWLSCPSLPILRSLRCWRVLF